MVDYLSSILAEIFILIISLYKLFHQLIFLYKYVVNIISFDYKNKVNEVLSKLNFCNKILKFTVEVENNRSVTFLNTKVIRLDNKILSLTGIRNTIGIRITLSKKELNFIAAFKNKVIKLPHIAFKQKN